MVKNCGCCKLLLSNSLNAWICSIFGLYASCDINSCDSPNSVELHLRCNIILVCLLSVVSFIPNAGFINLPPFGFLPRFLVS